MALTASVERPHLTDQELREYPVEASAKIYKGAGLGKSASGHAQPLVAGNVFLGLAYEEADNTGGADGAKKVRAYTVGDFEVPLSSAAQSNQGDKVYMSDDGTFTFTSTSNSFVGHCMGLGDAANTIVLRLMVNNPAV